MTENAIGRIVVDAAISVHRAFGPVELESVEHTTAAHKKQIQTDLRLTGCKLGFLLSFGESLMNKGNIKDRQWLGRIVLFLFASWRLGVLARVFQTRVAS